MLKSISWSEYIFGVTILLAVYYLIVGIKFFSTEIMQFLSVRRKRIFKPELETVGDSEIDIEPDGKTTEGFAQTSEREFEEVEQLIERLKEVIELASRKSLISEEFKYQLSMLLKEYSAVRDSPIQASVSEFIISECQKYGTVALSVEEMELLWRW